MQQVWKPRVNAVFVGFNPGVSFQWDLLEGFLLYCHWPIDIAQDQHMFVSWQLKLAYHMALMLMHTSNMQLKICNHCNYCGDTKTDHLFCGLVVQMQLKRSCS